MMNIINLRIVSKIILKYNKVSSAIKIDRRERINKIIKNKFLKLSV